MVDTPAAAAATPSPVGEAVPSGADTGAASSSPAPAEGAAKGADTPAPAPAAGDASPPPEAKPAASLLSEAKADASPAEPPKEPPKEPGEAAAAAAQEGAPKEGETPPVEPPPLVYEFTYPENFTPSEKEVSEFTDLLRAHNAPPELGQKLVEFYAQETARVDQASREVWDRTQIEWQDKVRTDPEIGGAKFDSTMRNCGRVMDEFGSPALREVLTATGAGNHPEVIRFVNKVAEILGEGKPVLGNAAPAGPPPSRADRRYNRQKAG